MYNTQPGSVLVNCVLVKGWPSVKNNIHISVINCLKYLYIDILIKYES